MSEEEDENVKTPRNRRRRNAMFGLVALFLAAGAWMYLRPNQANMLVHRVLPIDHFGAVRQIDVSVAGTLVVMEDGRVAFAQDAAIIQNSCSFFLADFLVGWNSDEYSKTVECAGDEEFVYIPGLENIEEVSRCFYANCARSRDKSLYCWVGWGSAVWKRPDSRLHQRKMAGPEPACV